MQDRIFTFERTQLDPQATEDFIRVCGFDAGQEKHRRMLDAAFELRERYFTGTTVKAVVSEMKDFRIEEDTLSVGGAHFRSRVFAQMRDVASVYLYILTAGDVKVPDDSIMDLLYADIWGTCYVDAGRDLLREEIAGEIDRTFFLSPSVGPGFYGMDLTDIYGFFRALEHGTIGVTLKDSGIMIPVKSCAGIFLALRSDVVLPQDTCADCIGTRTGCQFCRSRSMIKAKSR